MDYLQYLKNYEDIRIHWSFKPCYKWITFNTEYTSPYDYFEYQCFKPCYKWITFNTLKSFLKMGIFILVF